MNLKINTIYYIIIFCLCSIAVLQHIFVESPQVIVLKVNVRTKDRSVSCCGKKERGGKRTIESLGEGMLMRYFDVLELQTFNYSHSISLSSLPWWLLALLNIGIPIWLCTLLCGTVSVVLHAHLLCLKITREKEC